MIQEGKGNEVKRQKKRLIKKRGGKGLNENEQSVK